MEIDDIVIVAHLKTDDTKTYDVFQKISSKYRERFSFAVATVDNAPARIECYNNMEDEKYTITEFSAIDSLDTFLQRCATFLVDELTRRNEGKYLNVDNTPLSNENC